MGNPESTGEFLLINNNNTRTKFALADRDQLLEFRVIDTPQVTESGVRELLVGWSYTRVVLASVVPTSAPALIDATVDKPLVQLDCNSQLNVAIDFPDPSTVGADRIANAVAVAIPPMSQPVIVVDFGTAVTFDIVDQRPAYLGGVIAPGLDSMRNYLHNRTALLPIIELEKPGNAIGKSTVEAMLSGAFHGYRGLVKEILEQIQKELERPAKIIATGGYADLIAGDLPEIDQIEPQLTMLGLQKVACLNFPNE